VRSAVNARTIKAASTRRLRTPSGSSHAPLSSAGRSRTRSPSPPCIRPGPPPLKGARGVGTPPDCVRPLTGGTLPGLEHEPQGQGRPCPGRRAAQPVSRHDEEGAAMRSEESAQPIRVLITGSRTWARPGVVWRALDEVITRFAGRPVVLVHGDAARGADRPAAAWAAQREREGHPVSAESHPPDWAREGRAAGFHRNLRMVSLGADPLPDVHRPLRRCRLRPLRPAWHARCGALCDRRPGRGHPCPARPRSLSHAKWRPDRAAAYASPPHSTRWSQGALARGADVGEAPAAVVHRTHGASSAHPPQPRAR
jgi:hypothetical protein